MSSVENSARNCKNNRVLVNPSNLRLDDTKARHEIDRTPSSCYKLRNACLHVGVRLGHLGEQEDCWLSRGLFGGFRDVEGGAVAGLKGDEVCQEELTSERQGRRWDNPNQHTYYLIDFCSTQQLNCQANVKRGERRAKAAYALAFFKNRSSTKVGAVSPMKSTV